MKLKQLVFRAIQSINNDVIGAVIPKEDLTGPFSNTTTLLISSTSGLEVWLNESMAASVSLCGKVSKQQILTERLASFCCRLIQVKSMSE